MRGVTRTSWAAAVASALIAGCCPPELHTTGRAPRAAQARMESFAPLAFAGDARAPDRAVILGIDASDRSLVLPLAPPPPHVASPRAWSAIGWRAAFAAARALDKDVDDMAPYVGDATADRDSSAMLAVATLAAATGLPMDARVAIAGNVLLDGSIVTDTPVGQPPGTPAVVSDLAEAYQRATGKHLPEPTPLPAGELGLDATVLAELEAAYRDWRRELVAHWNTLIELDSSGRLPPALSRASQLARDASERAEHAHQHGATVEAYVRMERAVVYATATAETAQLIALARSGDTAAFSLGLRAVLSSHAAPDLEQHIATSKPMTPAGHLAAVLAFQAASQATADAQHADEIAGTFEQGRGFATAGGEQLGGPELVAQIAEVVVPALVANARARVARSIAERELAHANGDGPPHAMPIGLLQRAVRARTAAAAADGREVNAPDEHAAERGEGSSAATLDELARGDMMYANA